MNASLLYEQLQRLNGNHEEIVRLVRTNRAVFDKPCLSPNAINSIDRAIELAKVHKNGNVVQRKSYGIKPEEKGYKIVRRSYDMFLGVLGVVERTGYWKRLNDRLKPDDINHEITALRLVFGTYVQARLFQAKKPQYIRRLGISA